MKLAVEVKASDIHLKPGKGVVFRVNGQLMEVEGFPPLSAQDVAAYARAMMTEKQIEVFREQNEIDLAYSIPGIGRFRANVFRQRGSVAMALRTVPFTVPAFAELGLPPVVEKIANERRGLVLVTGSTGSGKSTTLAAMVNYINSTRNAHIITIEDPIEFLLKDKKSMIAQREVGFDTRGFLAALRSAMRQDPDVILVGEMRDAETIITTLMAAETGHLVLATLHTTDVMETINRILSFFDGAQATQVRYQFATAIRAIVCLRLLRMLDGKDAFRRRKSWFIRRASARCSRTPNARTRSGTPSPRAIPRTACRRST
ncbi:MAG: PilT/PilU family type 4a pilus ATPase [Deltaproteobacteria bacterium]|nr:PilT/PilU family type 4a pilus ATPase [Deltaproteobacteria bacterium]